MADEKTTNETTNDTFEKITNDDVQKIKNKSVISLPDNPVAYGYSANEIRGHFVNPFFDNDEKEPSLLKEILRIEDALEKWQGNAQTSSDKSPLVNQKYVDTIKSALETSFEDGSFANEILKLYSPPDSAQKKTLQEIINTIAGGIQTLGESKLDNDRISNTAVQGAIPVYDENGCLVTNPPQSDNNAVSKKTLDDAITKLSLEVKLDDGTGDPNDADYVLHFILKHEDYPDAFVESEIDLPLESMIIRGSYVAPNIVLELKNGSSISFPISALVSELVSETRAVELISNAKTEAMKEVNALVDTAIETAIGSVLNGGV